MNALVTTGALLFFLFPTHNSFFLQPMCHFLFLFPQVSIIYKCMRSLAALFSLDFLRIPSLRLADTPPFFPSRWFPADDRRFFLSGASIHQLSPRQLVPDGLSPASIAQYWITDTDPPHQQDLRVSRSSRKYYSSITPPLCVVFFPLKVFAALYPKPCFVRVFVPSPRCAKVPSFFS